MLACTPGAGSSAPEAEERQHQARNIAKRLLFFFEPPASPALNLAQAFAFGAATARINHSL